MPRGERLFLQWNTTSLFKMSYRPLPSRNISHGNFKLDFCSLEISDRRKNGIDPSLENSKVSLKS